MNISRALVVLTVTFATLCNMNAAEPVVFDVKGKNPGSDSGYYGRVELEKLSKSSGHIKWITGSSQTETKGITIQANNVIGAGYGDAALYALAVYRLNGRIINATWTLASNPKFAGQYQLSGEDFDGRLYMASGDAGSVTFKQTNGDLYEVAWDLPSGQFKGVGVRRGDILVAASGDTSGTFGVAGFITGQDGGMEGIWATNRSSTTGTEVWTQPDDTKVKNNKPRELGNGQTVEFNGENYHLRDKQSAPGQPTTELREYLQQDETWDGYRKLLGFHVITTSTDPAQAAKNIMESIQRDYPGSFVKEIEVTSESATFSYILVSPAVIEFNLWNLRKSRAGVAGAQFVMRNKPPYDTQQKFKEEQEKNLRNWISEIEELGAMTETYVRMTSKAKPEGGRGNTLPPETMQAVKKDLEECSDIARKFVIHLEADDYNAAINLMDDTAFQDTSRSEFIEQLRTEGNQLGRLQKYRPDANALNISMNNGQVTFTMEADGLYANGTMREVFRFVRSKQGKVILVGYQRTAKP